MAETHELRLKIDAAAAKRGSRDFVGAVEAIKRAVRDLEKDTSGAFTKLQKNIQSTTGNKTKLKLVDRAENQRLETFNKLIERTNKAMNAARKSVGSTAASVRNLTTAYAGAQKGGQALNTTLNATNRALQKQIELASKARAEIAGLGAASGRVRPVRAPTGGTGGRGGGAVGPDSVSQERVNKAIAQSVLQTERLAAALKKVGGDRRLSVLDRDLETLIRSLSKGDLTAKEMSSALTKFGTSTNRAATAVTTLKDKATQAVRVENELAAATKKAATEQERQAALQSRVAASLRNSEIAAVKMIARLREMGDTRGANQLQAALTGLQARAKAGITSMSQLRSATDTFNSSMGKSKASVTGFELKLRAASQQANLLARSERDAAAATRLIERDMRSAAGATNAASLAWRNATGNLRGMENAMNSTYQISSAFRTLMGTITLGSFISGLYSAGNAMDQFRTTMLVATGSMQGAFGEMDFVDQMTRRLGTSLGTAREDYSKFAVASDLAGVSSQNTRRIFESVAMSLSVLGRGSEDQKLAFLALEQMMSKGTISSEELRRQLGERLPGAVNLMAKAVGVSTGELQKLLKAGALASAEVLPKFATELEKAFGPGLEAAQKRAAANLSKLQNQFTRFTESAAQAGFMQQLAVSFKQLTTTMESPAVKEFGVAIGEGLTKAVQVGTQALLFLINNVEAVGQIGKAVFVGIVARQALLMANAFAVSAQKFASFFAGFGQGTAAMTAQEVATQKHTAALLANTKALTGQAGAAKVASVAQADLALKQAIMGASSTKAATSNTLLARSMTLVGASATRAAGAARVAAAGFSALAGPIGFAVSALLLIPGAMDKVGAALGFFDPETKANINAIEAAVIRSGASFEQLGDSMYETASTSAINTIIQDIDVLDGAIETLLSKNESRLTGLGVATGRSQGITGGALFDTFSASGFLEDAGVSKESIDGMTTGASAAAKDILLAFNEMKDGGQSALEVLRQIENADFQYPTGSELFGSWKVAMQDFVDAELAGQASLDRLVEVGDSATARIIKGFADSALRVYRTRDGYDELIESAKALASEDPDVKVGVEGILAALKTSGDLKHNVGEVRAEFQKFYTETAQGAIDARRNASDVATAYRDAQLAVAEDFEKTQARLSTIGGNRRDVRSGVQRVDPEVLESYEQLSNVFQNSENFSLPLEQLKAVTAELPASGEQAKAFMQTVLGEFAKLDASQQTFSGLDTTISRLLGTMPNVTAETKTMVSAMLENARAGDETVRSMTETRAAVAALDWPTEEARAMALSVFYGADAMIALAVESDGAGAAALAATGGITAIENAAAAAAGRVAGLTAALANLAGQSFVVKASGAAIVRDIERRTEIKMMEAGDRAAAQITEFGEGARWAQESRQGIIDAFNASVNESEVGGGPLYQAMVADRDRALAEVDSGLNEIGERARTLATTESPSASGGGGSGGGKGGSGKKGGKSKKSDAEKASERLQNLRDEESLTRDLVQSMAQREIALEKETNALAFLINGQADTEAQASLMADAMLAGGGAIDEQTLAMINQIAAAEKLNEQLTVLANDPVKAWMEGVPNWIEAGRQIELSGIGTVSDALKEFAVTGKMTGESFSSAMLTAFADVAGDMATQEIMKLLGAGEDGFGLGNILGGFLGGEEEAGILGAGTGIAPGTNKPLEEGAAVAAPTLREAIVSGGQQAATALEASLANAAKKLQTGVTDGGQQAATAQRVAGTSNATQLQTATTTAGQQHATSVQTAITTAGATHAAQIGAAAGAGGVAGGAAGGGGGFFSLSNLASLAVGSLSEGGISNGKQPNMASVSPAMFHNAPQFKNGTTNTSGIPAILHDNEAVVPLSGGRKIPVDMGDMEKSGGGGNSVSQVFHITTPDADSFRRSQKQVAAEGAARAKQSLSSNS